MTYRLQFNTRMHESQEYFKECIHKVQLYDFRNRAVAFDKWNDITYCNILFSYFPDVAINQTVHIRYKMDIPCPPSKFSGVWGIWCSLKFVPSYNSCCIVISISNIFCRWSSASYQRVIKTPISQWQNSMGKTSQGTQKRKAMNWTQEKELRSCAPLWVSSFHHACETPLVSPCVLG